MRAIDLLRMSEQSERKIRDIQTEQHKINDIVESIGRGSDPTGKAAVKLADLESKLDNEVSKYIKARETVKTAIEKLESEKQRRVLYLRYVCGSTWKEIESTMGYTDGRSLQRLHNRALKSLQKIIENNLS